MALTIDLDTEKEIYSTKKKKKAIGNNLKHT